MVNIKPFYISLDWAWIMHSKIKIIILCCCLFSAGCKTSFDEPVVSKGTADFSHFVALGGNFAAGLEGGVGRVNEIEIRMHLHCHRRIAVVAVGVGPE